MDEAGYGGSIAGQLLNFDTDADMWPGGLPPAGLVSISFNLFGYPPVAGARGVLQLDGAYNVTGWGFDFADGPPDGFSGPGGDSWFAGNSLWQSDGPGTWTTSIAPIPLPGAAALMVLGLGGLCLAGRRRL